MKKLSNDVVITFDYELFLGVDSGTAEKCIIKPVNYILEEFEKYNGKGIFFVDATYLLTLKICNKLFSKKELHICIKRFTY